MTPRLGVAIVGMGCRFPGGVTDPASYWRMLSAGQSVSTPIPVDRWGSSFVEGHGAASDTAAGFLEDIDLWDPTRYGIPPEEALRIDPQHRLLMDVVWDALDDAGIDPADLKSTGTGVFVGISDSQQYTRLQQECDPSCFADPYLALGNAASVAAGRIAFVLDTAGPAINVDTACSTSLVVTHLAVESLARGECELAIVAASSAILHPRTYLTGYEIGMLARDGRCKTFSREADGFGLGEGAGALVLERADAVEPRRRRPRAVIRGSAVNQDGNSGLLVAPRGDAQVGVIRRALERGGLDPGDIDFVEAHGSGTALGDAIELQALYEVFGDRPAETPLPVGAVKSVVGHLLVAAGMAGLIKVVLELEHGSLTPNVVHGEPTPILKRTKTIRPVEAPTVLAQSAYLRAGVSSFGWSGTNAHVVLEAPGSGAAPAADPGPEVLLVAADHADLVPVAAAQIADALELPSASLADVAHTLRSARSRGRHRRALVVEDLAGAAQALRHVVDAGPSADGVAVDPTFHVEIGEKWTTGFSELPSPVSAVAVELAELFPAYSRDLRLRFAGRPDETDPTGSRLSGAEADRSLAPVPADDLAAFVVCVATLTVLTRAGMQCCSVTGAGLGALVARALASGVAAVADDVVAFVTRPPPASGPAAPAPAHGQEPPCPSSDRHIVVRLVGAPSAGPSSDAGAVVLEMGGSRGPEAWLTGCRRLWELGADLRWTDLVESKGRVVSLPPRPSIRRRFWPTHVEGTPNRPSPSPAQIVAGAGTQLHVYAPGWRDLVEPADARRGLTGVVVLAGAPADLIDACRSTFEDAGCRVVAVGDPARAEDVRRLLDPADVSEHELHLVELNGLLAQPAPDSDACIAAFEHLTALVRVLGSCPGWRLASVLAAVRGCADLHDADEVSIPAAAVRGLARAVAVEYPGLRARVLDMVPSGAGGPDHWSLPALLRDELARLCQPTRDLPSGSVVALRGGRRWTCRFEEMAPASSADPWADDAVVVITGGTRGLGARYASHLSSRGRRRLALVGRTLIPPRREWPGLLDATATADPKAVSTIRDVLDMERRGASVLLLCADVARPGAMDRVLEVTERHFGRVDGVVHCAGMPGSGLLQGMNPESARAVIAAKVEPLAALEAWIDKGRLQAVVLYSSAVTELGGLGEADYAAANACLDGFARRHRPAGTRVVSIAWGPWDHDAWTPGAADESARYMAEEVRRYRAERGIHDEDGQQVVDWALVSGLPNVMALPEDLDAMVERVRALSDLDILTAGAPRPVQPRPDLRVAMRIPDGSTESAIAALWAEVLALEEVGVDDPFFELGGTSLIGAATIRRIERAFGCQLNPGLIFEYPTVALLAAYIDAANFSPPMQSRPEPSPPAEVGALAATGHRA